MRGSVEISMYPLNENYLTPIEDFIQRLNKHEGLDIQTNPMSTQIFGDIPTIFSILVQEMTTSFKEGKASFVLKVLGEDVQNILGE